MRRRIDIDKAAAYSIVINGVQIAAVLAIAFLVLFTDIEQQSVLFVDFIISLASLLVIWGAVVDIQQALSARRINEQSLMLEEAYGQLESLNVTLRAQRHDFLNHLQVVSSLLEMGEPAEASDYIERVYGDIRSVSTALKTGNPAVNALLKVKLGEGQARGVFMELKIQSKWDQLPVPGWEMCRVLGNLIDNALDALRETPEPRLTIVLGEDEKTYFFAVENNGPEVPEALRPKLFQSGFTTKGPERGMGLFIVRDILERAGGRISLESGPEKTAFRGFMPRPEPAEEQGENGLPKSAQNGIL